MIFNYTSPYVFDGSFVGVSVNLSSGSGCSVPQVLPSGVEHCFG